jgi:hypothetical protein
VTFAFHVDKLRAFMATHKKSPTSKRGFWADAANLEFEIVHVGFVKHKRFA